MLNVNIKAYNLGRDTFVTLRIEVKSPDLPEGQLTLIQEHKQSDFESLFDVIWKRAYHEITHRLQLEEVCVH